MRKSAFRPHVSDGDRPFELDRRRHDFTVDRQQRLPVERARIEVGQTLEKNPFAFRHINGLIVLVLPDADLTAEFAPLVQQADDFGVDGIDSGPQFLNIHTISDYLVIRFCEKIAGAIPIAPERG